MESTVIETSELKLPQGQPRHKMPLRTKIIFYLVAWLIVLMPFLFWRSTWFGGPLSTSKMSEYLRDDKHPRHIQHALVQMEKRMEQGDTSARQWYPDLVRLATYAVEEIRSTDAWVMGQDTSQEQFHRALLRMLDDPSLVVRGNAALSLVRFGDPAGHPQIVVMLKPLDVQSPYAGRVVKIANPGGPINHGTVLVTFEAAGKTLDVRAPITGKLKQVAVKPGDQVAPGAAVAIIIPGAEQVWEALRALYVIGTTEDLPTVRSFKNETGEYPQRIAQQAAETERAILGRAR
jgi:biotin carboxyl carrier protein